MRITQKKISEYMGVTEPFLSELRAGRRGLDKQRAKLISDDSGLSFESLMLKEGEELYTLLESAYKICNWGKP